MTNLQLINARFTELGCGFAVGLCLLAATLVPASAAKVSTLEQDLQERDYPLSLSGSYLAALTANRAKDIGAAALYYDRALRIDPDNDALVQRAFFLSLVDGDIERAVELSEAILVNDPNNWFAHMALGVVALRSKSFKKANRSFEEVRDGSLALLTGTLLRAWTLAGDDEFDAALALLGTLSNEAGFKTFLNFHSALIAEASGNVEQANKLYELVIGGNPVGLHRIEAYTRFQLRNGFEKEGRKALERLTKDFAKRPNIAELVREMEGGRMPAPYAPTILRGATEVFLELGPVIATKNDKDASYIFLNLGTYLNPENPLARIFLADLLEKDQRYEKAIENYQVIADTSTYIVDSKIGMAVAFNALDKVDEAREVMRGLLEKRPDSILARVTYGDILRSREDFEEARLIYNSALKLAVKVPSPNNWELYYSRGITNERTQRWDEAEKDFRKALELSPNEPEVLNYLGYSLIDKGMKYDEALAMVQSAVRQKPKNPYMIDSLGWAHYKLKNYEDAVIHLERAVDLRPQDSILHDHLGDAYWKIGRKREAVFQWQQSRDLKPDEKNIAKILKKIENGFIEDEEG